jgi:hypothetical protein
MEISLAISHDTMEFISEISKTIANSMGQENL